jgi:hypothetical protein
MPIYISTLYCESGISCSHLTCITTRIHTEASPTVVIICWRNSCGLRYWFSGKAALRASSNLQKGCMYVQRRCFHPNCPRATAVAWSLSRTWPVLDVPVAFLSTRVKAPTMSDVRKLKQVFGYIAANKDRRLRIAPTTLQEAAWADASFASHSDAQVAHGLHYWF